MGAEEQPTSITQSDSTQKPGHGEQSAPTNGKHLRSLIAVVALLAVFLYAAGIISGRIKPEHKLDVADTAVLALGVLSSAILFRPQLLTHLKHLKVGSLEFELQQLQQKQERQQAELDGVHMALTLALQPRERAILRKLQQGETQNETGSHDLRTDLRRLNALGLTRKIGSISEIKDGQKVNLEEKVALENLGKDYLRGLGDPEQ
jgi:hypothetical protein